MTKRDIEGPYITLTCAAEGEYPVYFEPWGSEYTIKCGDILYIRSAGLSNGGIEISIAEFGIIVCQTTDDEMIVTNQAGEVVKI